MKVVSRVCARKVVIAEKDDAHDVPSKYPTTATLPRVKLAVTPPSTLSPFAALAGPSRHTLMSSSSKAKEKEISSDAPAQIIDHSESGSEEDDEVDHTLPEASTPSTSSNKKKKKRSKAAKALRALRGKDNIPQEVVDVVLDKVRTEHADTVPNADEETVRAALEQMKIKDVVQGKAALGGTNKKDVGTHKVCSRYDAHVGFSLTCEIYA